MGVDLIFKIAGIAILVAVVNAVLKHIGKEEIATLTTLVGVVLVLMMVLDCLSELFDTVKNLFLL